MSDEERNAYETQWVRFKDEVFRRLDMEFSIRLGLLAADERMDSLGGASEKMHQVTSRLMESRQSQIMDDLFTRAREEGVGYYAYAMYEVYSTSNRLALEVVKKARSEQRQQLTDGDMLAAIDSLSSLPGHWPFS